MGFGNYMYGARFVNIQCEHFVYALFNDVGYRLVKSEGAEKLLTEDNFKRLCDLKAESETIVPQWFPHENVLAISLLTATKDEYGRRGTWNHTILIRAIDYLTLTDPVALVKRHFIRQMDNPYGTLKPLEVKK